MHKNSILLQHKDFTFWSVFCLVFVRRFIHYTFGDDNGKIFVLPVRLVERIRTAEEGLYAIR